MSYKTQWEFWPEIVNTYNMFTQLGVENFDGVFAMILNNVFKYYTKGIWKKFSSNKSLHIIDLIIQNTQYKVQGTHFFTLFSYSH